MQNIGGVREREREKVDFIFYLAYSRKVREKEAEPFAGCFEKRCCLVEISKIVVSVQFTLFKPLKIAFFVFAAVYFAPLWSFELSREICAQRRESIVHLEIISLPRYSFSLRNLIFTFHFDQKLEIFNYKLIKSRITIISPDRSTIDSAIIKICIPCYAIVSFFNQRNLNKSEQWYNISFKYRIFLIIIFFKSISFSTRLKKKKNNIQVFKILYI